MSLQQVMMMYKGSTAHTVTLSPNPADSSSVSPSLASVAVTADVSGGTGPFTYAWSIVSGIGATLTNATSATCIITTNTGSVGARSGSIKCDVTDTGNGSLVVTGNGTYTLEVL